jgi:hypothetical protein
MLLVFSCGAVGIAQQPECNQDCVQSVRDLLKWSYYGFSSGFQDKANYRLGDKVGAAVLRIYKGNALYKPDNIRTFLLVMQRAFMYPDAIKDPRDKDPRVTAALLRRLKNRIKDHILNLEITRTLNVITIEKQQTEPPGPTQPNTPADRTRTTSRINFLPQARRSR